MRFLGLSIGDRVPDAKTIWLFREDLGKAKLIKPLFRQFEGYLRSHGFTARKGQIVDASIVSVPIQRNSREENKQIKEGDVPEGWNEAKQRQKDVHARWSARNHKHAYGYKNHISVDASHKFIRDFTVTDAGCMTARYLLNCFIKRVAVRISGRTRPTDMEKILPHWN